MNQSRHDTLMPFLAGLAGYEMRPTAPEPKCSVCCDRREVAFDCDGYISGFVPCKACGA